MGGRGLELYLQSYAEPVPTIALPRAHTATCWTWHTSPLSLMVHLETGTARQDYSHFITSFSHFKVSSSRGIFLFRPKILFRLTAKRYRWESMPCAGGGEKPKAQGNISGVAEGSGRKPCGPVTAARRTYCTRIQLSHFQSPQGFFATL